MRRFIGSGGRLFLASDVLRFSCRLADVKDGWTFADADGSWWVDGSVSFFVDGVPVAAEGVWPLAGRVSFSRCLRGREVVAEGLRYPTASAVAAASWDLRVVVPIADTTGLADEVRTSDVAPGRSASVELLSAVVEPWLRDSLAGSRVLAWLPYARGLIVGVGVAAYGFADTSTVTVEFDEGEVGYVC